jgi:hypothetical protein
VAQTKKEIQIGTMFRDARTRARKNNLSFNITKEHLKFIAADECPIFKTPLEWGHSGLGCGKSKPNGPQLDRIVPELGYVEGNVAFISHRANRIKDNGTMQEHYNIADWIWANTHAKQNQPTPVSENHLGQSQTDSQLGSVLGAGSGQDCDGAHHHTGEPEGKDIDYRTQASCRICVGTGMFFVGASECHEMLLSNGVGSESIEDTAERLGCVCYQCGECSLVD